jgi:hypothetical protein
LTRVPFQNDEYESLNAFYVIIGCMGLWMMLMMPPLISTFRQMIAEDRVYSLLRSVKELGY